MCGPQKESPLSIGIEFGGRVLELCGALDKLDPSALRFTEVQYKMGKALCGALNLGVAPLYGNHNHVRTKPVKFPTSPL